jgi:RNA polymerase sigma-70 factor (ECF subfamily)
MTLSCPAAPRSKRPDEHATDDELMEQLRSGGVDAALTQLAARHRHDVQRVVQSILRDQRSASDLTEEAFEKVYLKSHLYVPGTNFKAWLCEVARNHALSALRKERRTPRPITDVATDENGELLDRLAACPEQRNGEERELMAEFDRAVDGLPQRYRVAFDLCVRQRRPYKEVAALLKTPKGTIAIRIHRAREQLFGQLARFLDERTTMAVARQISA